MNKRLSTLQTDFNQKLLAAAKAGALHVTDAAALAGLSEQQLAAAQQAAKDRKVSRLCAPAAEHDAAACARIADQPRHPPEAVRSEPQPRRKGRCERHARDHQRDRAAPRQEGRAVRLSRTGPTTRSTTRWRRTATTAVGFLDRLAPAVVGQADARRPPTSVRSPQSQGANFEVDPGGLELLRRADPQAALRAR